MAEEALITVAAEAVLNLVLSIAEDSNLTWGLKGELKKLSDKSTMIVALLSDADQRQVQGESAKLWLQKLKNTTYDADDVLDEFAYEILRSELEIQICMASKVCTFFSISNPIVFRFKMAHRVKKINMILEKVVSLGHSLGLNRSLETPEIFNNHREIRRTHPFVDDSKVVGRDVDKSKVVGMLLESECEQNLPIIAIVGMAGLGKTTLAQLVYRDAGVMRYFSERMWVCVSNDFDVTRLLREMGESLGVYFSEMSNIEGMIHKLKEKLNGNRYLLVLDDVWNTNAEKWECMINSLLGLDASKGSKILVTTRNAKVVSTMQTVLSHHLAGLSDNDSWFVFRKRAFASGGAKETQNLVNIGKRILKRCRGTPLAIKTLGAMMHSKEEEEWLSVEKSSIWEMCEDDSGILPALQLSFEHLSSPYLKRCFAYCSIFPKEFLIEKDILVQLWMAQGLLQPPHGSNLSMEEVGNEYFKNLLWNSFFQDVELDKYGNIMKCKMHDLMHDLAQFVSKSESLMLGDEEVNIDIDVRHVVVICKGETRPTNPKENAMKLRTLFWAGDPHAAPLLNFKWLHLKCLRVLNLSKLKLSELPDGIGKLKHLRYLDISQADIVAVPKSIAKLYNLQTLRLKYCFYLKELPKEMRNLINLRHLCFNNHSRRYQMPVEMGRLKCLRSLSYFVVGQDKGRRIEELGFLSNLKGKLMIYNLEYVRDRDEAEKADLMDRPNIYKLGIEWSSKREGNNNDEDVLEGLRAPPNLKSLKIVNFGGEKFPSWMMRMSIDSIGHLLPHNHLTKIKLINCNRCEQIPMLGHLAFLQILEIDGMDNVKYIGSEFYCYSNDGGASNSKTGALFPSLRRFTLKHMQSLAEWRQPAAAGVVVFPCLEVLTIDGCDNLITAPSDFPSLRTLSIADIRSGEPIAKISSKLDALTYLVIDGVSELSFLSEELLQNNKNLTSLEIRHCPALMHIPRHGWECCTILRSLHITCCKNLSHLPDALHNLTCLEELIISDCRNLTSIPSIQGLQRLWILRIMNCDGLRSLPSGLGSCTSLEQLTVDSCFNLMFVPEEDLSGLQSLAKLYIKGCGNLTGLALERSIVCLTHLKQLTIGEFFKANSFPFDFHLLQHQLHLQRLTLWGWTKLKSLPDQLRHLTALKSLSIINFDGVVDVPEWLGNLSSLQELELLCCGNLKHLPTTETMLGLTNLKRLRICACPLWKERCKPWIGPEWFKISHIPFKLIGF